ncbi:hypothetical protein M9458_050530, partial [Cirrhinus mrigala]
MVSGAPLLTQHRQDQGAGAGFQERERRTCPHYHQRDKIVLGSSAFTSLRISYDLRQGCQTQFLKGRSPAEFCSNLAPKHILCSFQLSLKELISWI